MLIPKKTDPRPAPNYNPNKLPILFYGRPGIGKTTLVSQCDPLILSTEMGADFVGATYKNINTWQELTQYTDAFFKEAGNHGFQTLVIDSIDRAFDLACDFVASRMGAKRINQKGRAGWAAVNAEFTSFLTDLLARAANADGGFDCGLIFISHEKSSFYTDDGRRLQHDEKWDGPLTEKAEPMISHRAKDIVCSSAYVIARAYMGLDGQRRLRSQPNKNTVAKDRTNVLPDEIPLSWEEFCKPLREAQRVANAKQG